jgi:hypothetical protein
MVIRIRINEEISVTYPGLIRIRGSVQLDPDSDPVLFLGGFQDADKEFSNLIKIV